MLMVLMVGGGGFKQNIEEMLINKHNKHSEASVLHHLKGPLVTHWGLEPLEDSAVCLWWRRDL